LSIRSSGGLTSKTIAALAGVPPVDENATIARSGALLWIALRKERVTSLC
jgi:hypothetical protein